MRRFVIVVGLLMMLATAAGAQQLAMSTPLSGTQWQLVSIDGALVVPDSIVTLLFGTENDTAGGNGGCNIYSSSYTADETSISISDVFSTFIACEETLEQEQAYFAALQAAERYTISDGMLTITSSDGAELVFEPLITLTGNAWVLTNIGGEAAARNSRLTLVMNEDGTAVGNGGCNHFRTTYTFDQQTIAFGGVVSTRMACVDEVLSAQEMAYFAALEGAHSFRLTEDGMLIIGYGGADETLEFTTQFTLAQSPAPGEVPAGLKRFYEQELTFGSCASFATSPLEELLYVDPFECARLEVPLNYDDPNGATMQIGVLRLRALGEADDRIGSLLINPGGPGGSGMQVAVLAVITGLGESPILQQFDMVGFDPRGVGASTPAISCFTDEENDRGENKTTLLGTSGEWSESDTRELMEKCAEGSGGQDVIAAVGTRNVARDMDVLRAALGDEKLTFVGQSYGTRLGAVYAEMFPQNVRAMVLDGVLDPRQGSEERRLALHAGFQRSFDLMAEFCAQSPDCPLGTDPAQATAVFQDLVRPLIDNPVPAGNGRTMNFFQATGGVGSGLYTSEAWPRVIDGIAQLKNEGRGDGLLALNDDFTGRNPNGVWSNFIEANLAINCNDEERRTPEQEADLRRRIFEVNPFLDTGRPVAGVTRDACEFWPVEPTLGFPYAQNVQGLPDILVISITGDPSTPYAAGASLADSIGGTLLTVTGERHTVALESFNPCVNAIVADYLINLKLPDEGTTCTL